MELKQLWESGGDQLAGLETWRQLPMMYQMALDELQNKIKLIQTEWKHRQGYNPIEHIKTRIKEPASILAKMQRKGLAMTPDNLVGGIHDIAGMRIVCAFVKDIYSLVGHLQTRDDLNILEIKDYIAEPKPNGYQSLHLIVSVPLILMEGPEWIKVEIQLRTLAMDFWASMEHILFYKYDKQVPAHVIKELTEAARAADELDKKMLGLRKEIIALSEGTAGSGK
ncbi:GTP pyrophosphokinase [Paenibacillus pinistramenti]|uniref:GTP pyrophosphokinase n=1 Tax=Paenibacillus pinistramenti TaxID=1768003 RepID=UPI0011099F9A|nr:GTP pyrophosphokinase family protein [Paenibacillus pinistramenti]